MARKPSAPKEQKRPAVWELYERLVARLIADQLDTGYCVTPNASVAGQISGRQRQIDVLIDQRHTTDNRRRIIVDAKVRTRSIDVTHVEAFRGLMDDVEATHGYLVCPIGFTPAALRRAQEAVSIRLLPLDHLDDFDPSSWPDCVVESCNGGKVFWDGYPSFDMTLVPLNDPTKWPQRVSFIHYVGKCDRCRRFHVKCTSCGDLFSVTHDSAEDYGTQCSCKHPWFWLASIEEDENGRKSAELHFVAGASTILTVDRRSI